MKDNEAFAARQGPYETCESGDIAELAYGFDLIEHGNVA